MRDTIKFVPSLLFLIGSVVLWILSIRARRKADSVKGIPTVKIAQAARGMVQLQGSAVAPGGVTLVSPLTKTPCVWYDYKITEESLVKNYDSRHRDSYSQRSRTLEKGFSDRPFAIQDDSGTAGVNPEGAEVVSRHQQSYQSHYSTHGGPPVQGSRGKVWYEHHERFLLPGDPLVVVGWMSVAGSGDPMVRGVSERLRALKKDPVRMAGLDTDGDGRISSEEWDEARAQAEAEVNQDSAGAKADPATHRVGKPPQADQHFLVTNLAKSSFFSGFKTQATFFAALAVAAALAAALTLLSAL